MIFVRKRIGVALGGGGARGIAHIGVLRVFEQERIPVDLIVGTSIGALVGGAFACGMDTHQMEELIHSFLESPTFKNSAIKSIKDIHSSKKLSVAQRVQAFFKNRYILAQALFRVGMLQHEDFQAMIDYFLPDIDIQDCQIKFRAVATDLLSGEAVVLDHGPIRRAVMASCAVPGAVPPVELNGKILSDGGIVYLVPTTPAKEEGAGFVVGVSVNTDLASGDEFRSAMDIYVRSTEIMGYHLERCRLKEADVVIRPDVGRLHWTEFDLADDLISEGMRATKEKLHLIRKALPFYKRWGRGKVVDTQGPA